MNRRLATRGAAAAAVATTAVLGFVVVPPAAGAALPTCGGRPATVLGTDRGDVLTGTAGDDVFVTLGGGDVIDAGAGNDLICAGDGGDVVKAGPGNDTVDGGTLNDSIDGGDGVDRCVQADRDALTACETTGSSMYALTGAVDTPASDASPGSSPAPTTTTAPSTTPTTPSTPATCLGRAATIVGTELGDVITGTAGSDVIVGNGGGDVINAAGGDDTICGGTGRDQITGGDGADTIDGGSDGDSITGGPGRDRLTGADGDDSLTGEADRDNLDGGPGRDMLDGGTDADLLVGSDGDDVLRGGTGDDVLDPGFGRDSVFGDEDNDACVPVVGTSTVTTCEGVAKLLPVSGGSVTSQEVTLTVPAGILSAPAYGAVRPEIAGQRVTKPHIIGTLGYVDLMADWQGRGAVTVSMPFDATGTGLQGTVPVIYRFGDDGTISTLEGIRRSSGRVDFETTKLSGFAPGYRYPCNVPRPYLPNTCQELTKLVPPANTAEKAASRDSVAMLVACGVGGALALIEPTPFGEAAVIAGCLTGVAAEVATPPEATPSQQAINDCAANAAPISRSGYLATGIACATGIVGSVISTTLTDLGCQLVSCVTLDADVAKQRAANNPATGGGSQPGGNSGGTPSNPQGPTYNPQGPTYNPQGPTYNPQGPTYNPQGP